MDTNAQTADPMLTYDRGCPSRTVIEVLANKWTSYVLAALRQHGRPMRFSELRRVLDGVMQKMLTHTLRALERDGLVSRVVYPTVPPRVEYGLTELGTEAGQLTTAIADWSVRHAPTEAYGPAPDPDFVRVFHYQRGLSIAGPDTTPP